MPKLLSNRLVFVFAFTALLGLTPLASAIEVPPQSDGVISNPTLVANQDVAKAQAVGIITSFMGTGSQTCDSKGQNCRSLFGSDDSADFGTLSSMSQGLAGVGSFSYRDPAGGSNSVATQTGTLALACGDTKVHTVAGVAFKALGCFVNASGDAQVQFQVCTAPMRSNPVTQPENAVVCSADPAAPNFKAPIGKVCLRPACDTEPIGSLNGWSAPMTLSWESEMPSGSGDAAVTNNGLALVFYPALGGGITPSYSADSDNMTAVKIVQTFVNSETQATAVGIKLAYRHKLSISKDMLVQGPSAVPDPGVHSGQWDTILKLAGNAMIPQYQAKYAKNGTECLQQIANGLATDGVVSVCDPDYTNESGVRPIALTAQMAAQDQNCGTTAQCLEEVVNTNTWTQTCTADAPLSLRSCQTDTPYTLEDIHSTRSRPTDVCTEKRLTTVNSCMTKADLVGVAPNVCAPGTVLVSTYGPNACGHCLDNYQYYYLTCQANDSIRIQWYTSLPNGSIYSTIVDRTIQVRPYEASTNYLGAYCYDGSGTVPLNISCNSQACTYTTWITGNCNGAAFGLRAIGSASINYRGEFRVINGCESYEAAS